MMSRDNSIILLLYSPNKQSCFLLSSSHNPNSTKMRIPYQGFPGKTRKNSAPFKQIPSSTTCLGRKRKEKGSTTEHPKTKRNARPLSEISDECYSSTTQDYT